MDGAERGWHGHVGVVTELLADLPLDPTRTAAVVCRPEVMLRLAARVLADRAVPAPAIRVSLERNMKCAVGHFGRCQLRPGAGLPRRRGLRLPAGHPAAGHQGAVMARPRTERTEAGGVEVRLLHSCQLKLLDCENELLELVGQVEIASFPEASSAQVRGPYDLSLVEGSITTPTMPADPGRAAGLASPDHHRCLRHRRRP